MEFNKLLFERRSTRAYTDRILTADEINYILTAAVNAPSACNMQSWHFYCVTDPAVKERFRDFCADWVSTAPVVFVICTDEEGIVARFGEKAKKFPVQDTALAMENMLLAAADIGLGGCIIGAYDDDKCRAALNIPEKFKPIALMPVGEPTAPIPPRPRKPLSEVVTYIGDAPKTQESAESAPSAPYTVRCAWLPGAVFDDVGLPGATFNNINMSGVKFNDINMESTDFGNINLKSSHFGGLTMDNASFGCVELNGAVFKNVEFKNARFENCDFSGATIDGKKILEE